MWLRITADLPMGDSGDDGQFMTWFDVLVLEDGHTEEELEIGRARIALVHAGLAWERGEPLWAILDAGSGELADLAPIYFDEEGNIIEEYHHGFKPDLLFVADLELEPEWQGNGLELGVVQRLIDAVGGNAELVVMPAGEDAAQWERMGFERTAAEGDDGWHYLHLSTALRQPTVKDPDHQGRVRVIPSLGVVRGGGPT